MGESTEEGYRVEIKNKERVAAVLPLQEHWLSLSNLDLLLPPLHFGVFLCYSQEVDSPVDFSSTLASLKSSLAKALVTYYPFAGEVVLKSSGEPELLCNNRGVEFVTAYADTDLVELNLHDPDESVEKKLVPSKPESVLCVQATELRCGGLVVGCAFDHRVADAYSANMFLVLWSEISNRRSSSTAPCFRRSLLSPRRPGLPDASIDRLYMPISSVKMKPADNETINRIYYITAADISKMQAEAKSSKMEAFSAYLWKLIAKAAVNKKKWCRIGVVVNGRARLKQLVPSMDRYFGNVLTIPYGAMRPEEVSRMKLSDVAASVHDFVADAATEEHFLGLIDWVEAHRPEPSATRIYFDEEDDGVNFVVSSGREFPVAEVELAGRGRAVFGSYHFPWGGGAGYVMPMPSARGDGDWVVYVHLMREVVEAVEAEAGEVFRRLTKEYVFGG